METKHTPGPWKINHWENGQSGVTCVKIENGITYFSGDAVYENSFGIRAKLSNGVQGSFEGSHIAEIHDFSDESKANAKLISAAPDLLEALIQLKNFASRCIDWVGDDPPIELVEKAIKKATE